MIESRSTSCWSAIAVEGSHRPEAGVAGCVYDIVPQVQASGARYVCALEDYAVLRVQRQAGFETLPVCEQIPVKLAVRWLSNPMIELASCDSATPDMNAGKLCCIASLTAAEVLENSEKQTYNCS
jgi:hypothetical protein